jgi:PhnB protein
MLADEFPDMGIKSPKSIGGSPVNICLYVEDVDATFEAAVSGGAKALQNLENKFYGDRAGQIEDPYGHIWSLMTHVEDVSEEEMRKRMAEQMPG